MVCGPERDSGEVRGQDGGRVEKPTLHCTLVRASPADLRLKLEREPQTGFLSFPP